MIYENLGRLGVNSSNSGTPTSKESIEAAAGRKAVRQASQRMRSKDRRPGGQNGTFSRPGARQPGPTMVMSVCCQRQVLAKMVATPQALIL